MFKNTSQKRPNPTKDRRSIKCRTVGQDFILSGQVENLSRQVENLSNNGVTYLCVNPESDTCSSGTGVNSLISLPVSASFKRTTPS